MAAVSDEATLVVRQLTGAPLSVMMLPTSTVAQLKKLVESKTSVAVDSQRVRSRALTVLNFRVFGCW